MLTVTTKTCQLNAHRFTTDEPWPPHVHTDPSASLANPEKKNPHIHSPRGSLFPAEGDFVITTPEGEFLALLEPWQFDRLFMSLS
jgi:hypothetical protein